MSERRTDSWGYLKQSPSETPYNLRCGFSQLPFDFNKIFHSYSLLNLPRELRELVYEYLVVPGDPLEFASITYTEEAAAGHYYGPDKNAQAGFILPNRYHLNRLKRTVKNAVNLMLVTRQVHDEVAPILYGQELRFSGIGGSIVLYYWLDKIGPTYRQMVRNITVSHPAVAENCSDILFECLERRAPRLWSMSSSWGFQSSDLTTKLLSMTQLQSFTVVLPPLPEEEGASEMHVKIALHLLTNTNVLAALPSTDVSFAILLPTHGQRQYEFTLDDAFDPNVLRNGRAEVEFMLSQLLAHGWNIVQQYYDNHYTYPVSEGELCANADVCYKTRKHEDFKRDNLPRVDWWPRSQHNTALTKYEVSEPSDAIIWADQLGPEPRRDYSQVCACWWEPRIANITHRFGSIEAKAAMRIALEEVADQCYADQDRVEAFDEAFEMELVRAQIEYDMFEARQAHRRAAGEVGIQMWADERDFAKLEMARSVKRELAMRDMEAEYGPCDGNDYRWLRQ